MGHLSSRLHQDEKDIQAILELTANVRPPEHLNDYPAKVNIEENLVSPAVHATTRLWFDDDQPIAWAYVDEFNNLWWDIDARHEELLGAQIIAWGETCVRKTRSKTESTTLGTACREDYLQRILFLRQFGFQQTESLTIRMKRDLSEPIPAPTLPPGFTIRPLAGIQEAETVASMHRAAFGTEYMTTENRLAIMNTSEYDTSLDLVAIASDGRIVANCICSANGEEQIGKTDPIATHPRFQRMGLARALLLTGLNLLKGRGMRSAHLGTSGNNVAMQKIAESVGFTIEYRILWFSKEVY